MKMRVYSDMMSVLAKDNAERAARRDQRRIERNSDPAWQEVKRIREQMEAERRAVEEAEKAETAKHKMIVWPGALGAHVDRGTAKSKASFVPYLVKAVADYERDYPDQAPVPMIDNDTAALERRAAESLARARDFSNPGADAAKLLAVQPSFIGDEEFAARHAARQSLRQKAANPIGSENPMVGEASPTPPHASAHDAELVERGRKRLSKSSKLIEMTDDGALFEDHQ